MRSRYVDYESAIQTRQSALARNRPVSIVDPAVDSKWANAHVDSQAPNPYYDYYYAAEDMKVYVAELAGDPEFADLPMHELGFNVSQEKAPVYGAFSYTYDAVMRGTRIVSGSFTLVSKYPSYMNRLLTKAANARESNAGNLQDYYPRPPSWEEDDKNIKRYWSRHLDPAALTQGNSEWSIHPPFSLVVVYGIQDTSAEPKMDDRYTRYSNDQALMKDRNQRLVESSNQHSDRLILDAIELMNVNRIFSPNSPVVMEQYEFMARDLIIPHKSATDQKTEIPESQSGGSAGGGTHRTR